MAPLIKMSNPIRLGKLTNVMQIRGVDTYVHWSVFAVAAFILAGVARRPGLTLRGLFLYLAVLLIHESGHLIAAQRKRCKVLSSFTRSLELPALRRLGPDWTIA